MQNLLMLLAASGLLFTSISSSLDTSTQIHCANGIETACEYLSK